MKKILFFMLFCLVSFMIQAQISVKEGSFKEVGQFYTMREDMTDDNYTPYAVIRVKGEKMTAEEIQNLGFKGDARTFIEVEPHNDEVWVYLTYLATYLKITHPDLSTTEFTIPYDLKPLHGYELVVVNGAAPTTAGKGVLTVTTVPEGATLVINNVTMQVPTPYHNDMMAAGKYTITVSKPNYITTTRTVDIADNADVKVEIRMDLSFGKINIETEPAGATVYVDDIKKGVSPLTINDVRIGTHVVKIEKNDYETIEEQINLEENKELKLRKWLHVFHKTRTFSVKHVTFEMVEVKGGTFMMGATPEQEQYANDDEKPVHKVTVSDYYIGRFEVTQSLWLAVMGGKNPSHKTGSDKPVESVSWNDVQKFIKKLNKITKANFRLPTEAEWQYAARGGKWSKGYVYSGGDDLRVTGWFTDNSGNEIYGGGRTSQQRQDYMVMTRHHHDVGGKNPNELGLYDMSGNVFEYCSDFYTKYSSESQTNPTGSATGNKHVVVSGSYKSPSHLCRITSRIAVAPDEVYHDCGFRLALDP